MSSFMDDLIIPGAIALVFLYTGIVLIVYAVLLVLYFVFHAAITGNYLELYESIAGITGAIFGYILIGLWLRRTGTI